MQIEQIEYRPSRCDLKEQLVLCTLYPDGVDLHHHAQQYWNSSNRLQVRILDVFCMWLGPHPNLALLGLEHSHRFEEKVDRLDRLP